MDDKWSNLFGGDWDDQAQASQNEHDNMINQILGDGAHGEMARWQLLDDLNRPETADLGTGFTPQSPSTLLYPRWPNGFGEPASFDFVPLASQGPAADSAPDVGQAGGYPGSSVNSGDWAPGQSDAGLASANPPFLDVASDTAGGGWYDPFPASGDSIAQLPSRLQQGAADAATGTDSLPGQNPGPARSPYCPAGADQCWPTIHSKINSGFGVRTNPSPEFHDGIDIRSRLGDPIFSVENGTVLDIYHDDKGGDQVLIQNDDGSLSGYAHTGALGSLQKGQKVLAGDQIGISNGSGTSASHLHYTYRPPQAGGAATRKSDRVDPFSYQLDDLVRPPNS